MSDFDNRINQQNSDNLEELTLQEKYIRFDSKSEFACAMLLEKYVKDWRCKPNQTFQIPVDRNRKIDFRVGDTFLEYHPIVLQREFINAIAHHEFIHALKEIPNSKARVILDAITKEYESQYCRKRRYAVIYSPFEELSNLKMICCFSEKEFFAVLRKLGNKVPNDTELFKQWYELVSAN
jgi:hypothetical protein